MKSTDSFKLSISQHLEGLANIDPLFAETLKKPNKNLDDCITYILNQVKDSGCNGFEDSEIFGMATHYYDEDEIKTGSPMNCRVVVNHTVELSQEEIIQAKQAALDKIISEQTGKSTKKTAQNKSQILLAQQSFF